jgi:peptidoglycan/LPS O-acetylase OafA/YrhL
MAVVVYHLYPNRLPGGFAGVDVFFVISGFLISDHLIREAAREGKVSFSRFYARRARRILPSALIVLVLVLSLLGTFTWTAIAEWETAFRQIFASALFFQNWQLALDNVDYLTAGAPPSVVQNYWSLAVEEQFYLFWPLVIWIAFRVLYRAPRIPVKSLAVLFSFVGLASFAFSVSFTVEDPVRASLSPQPVSGSSSSAH